MITAILFMMAYVVVGLIQAILLVRYTDAGAAWIDDEAQASIVVLLWPLASATVLFILLGDLVLKLAGRKSDD